MRTFSGCLRVGVGLLAVALLVTGCSSISVRASRLSVEQQQAMEARGSDGTFEGAFNTAESFERFNDPRAVRFYERAAAVTPWTFNNAKAEEALGRIWASGRLNHAESPNIDAAPVLRASWKKGERWYLIAANHGNPYAFSDLAKAYRQRGDARLALRWDLRSMVYHRSTSRSQAVSEMLTAEGDRVHPLVARIQRQAERGDAGSQVDLGALLEKGAGLPADPVRALVLYEAAGAQGDVFGQYFAGLLLGRGAKGLAKDPDAAAAWFAKADAQRFYMAAPAYWQEAIRPPFFIFSE